MRITTPYGLVVALTTSAGNVSNPNVSICALHAGDLLWSERAQATVITVIHEVVDGI